LSQAYGYQSGLAFALVGLAGVAAARGHAARAARLLGAASAVLEAVGIPMSFNHEQQRQTHAAAREMLTESEFAAAWDAGRVTPIAELVAGADADEPGPVVAAVRRRDAMLSLREEEVLRLLVSGHTDREIAGQLFISPRTVQGHVAHIFDKLGVNSRTAAVTAAFQSGLLTESSDPR
jgi:DNA-binding CsgD family transcriptional regulator